MSNEEIIWKYLKIQGMTDAGIAGMMGNIYAESGLESVNLENYYNSRFGMSDNEYATAVDNGIYTNFVNDSAGWGICQWTYWSRKQALYTYAKSRNKSIGDIYMQLEFLYKELKESFPSVLNALMNATSVREASDKVLLNFECPADQSESVKQLRASYGQVYYDKYAKKDVEELANYDAVIDLVIKVAEAEVGYTEKASNYNLDDKTANAGTGNWTKYARDLYKLGVYNGNKNGYAWCDVFADWCYISAYGVNTAVKMINQPMGGCGAGCEYSASYYKEMGRFYKTPERGDQIFFVDSDGDYCHTGIVYKVDNTYVYTIEGNTTDVPRLDGEGVCVAKKKYSRNYSRIGGYGRPDWSLVKIKMEEVDMTKEEVIKLINDSIPKSEVVYNTVEECPEFFKPTIAKLVDKGYLKGDSNGLNLSYTMTRILVILDRAGNFDD